MSLSASFLLSPSLPARPSVRPSVRSSLLFSYTTSELSYGILHLQFTPCAPERERKRQRRANVRGQWEEALVGGSGMDGRQAGSPLRGRACLLTAVIGNLSFVSYRSMVCPRKQSSSLGSPITWHGSSLPSLPSFLSPFFSLSPSPFRRQPEKIGRKL